MSPKDLEIVIEWDLTEYDKSDPDYIFRGLDELGKAVELMLEDRPIRIGDIVYHSDPSWRRVPFEVVEVCDFPEPAIVLKGSEGWNVRGKWDKTHDAFVRRIYLDELTRVPPMGRL